MGRGTALVYSLLILSTQNGLRHKVNAQQIMVNGSDLENYILSKTWSLKVHLCAHEQMALPTSVLSLGKWAFSACHKNLLR